MGYITCFATLKLETKLTAMKAESQIHEIDTFFNTVETYSKLNYIFPIKYFDE